MTSVYQLFHFKFFSPDCGRLQVCHLYLSAAICSYNLCFIHLASLTFSDFNFKDIFKNVATSENIIAIVNARSRLPWELLYADDLDLSLRQILGIKAKVAGFERTFVGQRFEGECREYKDDGLY